MTLNVPHSDDEADDCEANRQRHIDCKCEDHAQCVPDEPCSQREVAWAQRFERPAIEDRAVP